jgi:hypothetical protein
MIVEAKRGERVIPSNRQPCPLSGKPDIDLGSPQGRF